MALEGPAPGLQLHQRNRPRAVTRCAASCVAISHSLGVTNFTDTHRMVCAALSAFCMHVACSRITWPACCTHAGRSCEVSDDLTTSSTSVAGAPHCRSRLYAGACRQSAELTARCAWQVVSRPVRCVHDVLRLGRASRSYQNDDQVSTCSPHLHLRPRRLRRCTCTFIIDHIAGKPLIHEQ